MTLVAPMDSPPNGRILSISPPEQGKTLARKVVTRSRARSTGKYPSWKMNRMVQWESPHELNALRLLDANPSVLSFQEQPAVIHYCLNGEEHKHYPDVLVCLKSGKEFWEVKTQDEASKPETAARTRLMKEELPKWGYSYRVVLSESLAEKPRLDTALEILKWGRPEITAVAREQIRALFSNSEGLTWGVFTTEVGRMHRPALCRLVLEGTVYIDLEKQLTENSPLKWAGD